MAFYLRRTLWAPLIIVAVSALVPHFLILAGIWALGALAVYAKPRAYLAGFLTALLVWALLFGPDYISQWAFYGFVGALTAAVLATTSPFTSGAITYLSNSSYSLYAIHMPILVLMAAALGHTSKLKWFACMAIALAAAYVFSRLTEAHTGKVRQLIARGFPFRYPTPDAVRYSDE
jgi:peptidoglycan/LPS O-acetylase OafA/YrhL